MSPFDNKEEIDSGKETPDDFLPPMSKSKNKVGRSCVTKKVINLIDKEATAHRLSLLLRRNPQKLL